MARGRREFLSRGSLVRVRRPRDGRRKEVASVEAYDAERNVATVVVAGRHRREISGAWCFDLAEVDASQLPRDVLTRIAAFLTATRSLRAACASSLWRGAFGRSEPGENWRGRFFCRWPPPLPRAAGDEHTDWLASFEDRRAAELRLRLRARHDMRNRAFTLRLCAWPLCLAVLDTRRTALAHHRTHPRCWTHFTDGDLAWLDAQTARYRRDYDKRLPAARGTSKDATLLANARARYRNSRALARAARRALRVLDDK